MVFFSVGNTWGPLKYDWSKNVLKHLFMNDIGYPSLKICKNTHYES